MLAPYEIDFAVTVRSGARDGFRPGANAEDRRRRKGAIADASSIGRGRRISIVSCSRILDAIAIEVAERETGRSDNRNLSARCLESPDAPLPTRSRDHMSTRVGISKIRPVASRRNLLRQRAAGPAPAWNVRGAAETCRRFLPEQDNAVSEPFVGGTRSQCSHRH